MNMVVAEVVGVVLVAGVIVVFLRLIILHRNDDDVVVVLVVVVVVVIVVVLFLEANLQRQKVIVFIISVTWFERRSYQINFI